MSEMYAIVAKGYGGPEVFSHEKVARPIPRENEVLVKVMYTNATRADAMMRTGKPWMTRLFVGLSKPKNPIPGTGFSGVIEAVGQGVTKFALGDRVFGMTTLGFSANAEYLAINESGVILHATPSLPLIDAAVLCDGPLTSYNFLSSVAGVKANDRVLVIGASGSLGTSAVQIAKSLGAEVVGVASGRNRGLVNSLGADGFIDYQQADFSESGVAFDWVFDTIGASSFAQCKAILKPHGTYLSPVMKVSVLLDQLRTLRTKGKKARFVATGLKSDVELVRALQEVVNLYEAGKLRLIIDRQFPLSRLSEAHRYIDTGRKRGNVILVVNQED